MQRPSERRISPVDLESLTESQRVISRIAVSTRAKMVILVLAIAGSMVKKPRVPAGLGTSSSTS